MAAVSSTPLQNGLRSDERYRGGQSSWDYAVPLNEERNHASAEPQSGQMDTTYTSGTEEMYDPQQQRGQLRHERSNPDLNGNRKPREKRSRTNLQSGGSKQVGGPATHTLQPPPQTLGRKASDLSGVSSEPDSLLDLYGRTSGERVDQTYSRSSNAEAEPPTQTYDPDNSHWIHRDKLAKIENEEMQRAGITIGRDSRSHSRQAEGRSRSKEHRSSSGKARDASNRGEKRRRVTSPTHAEVEEREREAVEQDPETPEEFQRDFPEDEPLEHPPMSPPYSGRPPSSKSNQSRIPLFKSSPAPVLSENGERSASRQRARSGSLSGTLNDVSRSRGNSVGSQALLDEVDERGRRTPPLSGGDKTPPSSPPKQRQVSGPAAVYTNGSNGTRKISTPQTRVPLPQQKSRSKSGQQQPQSREQSRDSPAQGSSSSTRPGTRSGEKKPEGDPPWLATMYKPDPRLPPDEQLLPTVAKRIQQEQWQREGKVGSVYDRQFNPQHILDKEFAEQQKEKRLPETPEDAISQATEKASAVPQAELKKEKSPAERNAYKTIPDLQQRTARGPQPFEPRPMETVRVPEPPEDEKQKKSCACCVVM